MNKMDHAFKLFDEYNQSDTNIVVWEGETNPAEYFYALQLYNWVNKLTPIASEYLLLASRAQHIGRWKSPRQEYPEGKAGYLNWRKDLKKFHAKTAGELMITAGYETEAVTRVQQIILKENLKSDVEVQIMENALCLVFLQFQYADFILKHSNDDQVTRILKKTWNKMSEPGRLEASKLNFTGRGKELITNTLAN